MENSLRLARRDVDIDDIDNTSCCSGDTVLSVGQESPSPAMAYRGIHSHLSAISQISHDLRNGASLMLAAGGGCGRGDRSPLSPHTPHTPQSPLSLQSPRSTNSPHSPESSPSPRATEPLPDPNENNNLKFSIDNILKADFGRRITDSLKSRSSAKNKALLAAARAHHRQSTAAAGSAHLSGQDSDSSTTTRTEKSGGIADLNCTTESTRSSSDSGGPMVWPAWVYCTRYSDRPSSGRSPRSRRPKKAPSDKAQGAATTAEEKRPRTAFSGPQLARLKHEFAENRYLTERRRQQLSAELGLNEAQIKIWFQNKRAKIKKASGQKNPLALQLMAQGLYNHSTVPLTREEEELQELHNS